MGLSKKGFIPVMLTPFAANGDLDYTALGRLTDLYLEAGAAGLFANCLSSEMFELTETERLRVITQVVGQAKGAVPVVATGSFGSTLREHADFIKRVYDTGVHAVILISSLLAREDEGDAVLEDRVMQLLELTPGIPVGFYECPVPYKRVIRPEQLGRFADTGRVRYHKDTCLDITQVKEKLKAVKVKDFGLYDAYIGHALESLRAGSAGLSCIQGNFFPEMIVWLCDHFQDEAMRGGVEEVQQFFVDQMEVMHQVYPVVAKYFLKKRGLDISTFTRRQVGIYSSITGQGLEKLYEQVMQLGQRLEIRQVL